MDERLSGMLNQMTLQQCLIYYVRDCYELIIENGKITGFIMG